MPSSPKVIAVGGGPAGIAIAIECVEFGMKPEDILILEKGPNPIEAIRKFYPDKKMTLANYKGLPTETHGHLKTFPDLTKAETIVYFDDLLKKYNLKMKLNSEVIKVNSTKTGAQALVGRDTVDAGVVVIGIGILGRPNKPAYKLPNSLRDHILFDLTSQEVKGKKVLVVGGGDTSSEYCQVLVEENNSVTLACRGADLSRMMDTNANAVMKLQSSNKLRYLKSTEVSEVLDEGGHCKVTFKDGTQAPEVFEKIIFAIGGTTPVNFLKTAGVDCEGNLPKYAESGSTNAPNVYLAGDLVCGKLGGSIITAYNSAFRAVSEFHGRLK